MKTWGKMHGGRRRAIRPAVLTAVALGVALSALGRTGPAAAAAGGSALTSRPAAERVEVTAAVVVARYTFDAAANGAAVTVDPGHGHTLVPSAGHGGKVRLAERLAGRA